MSATPVNKEAIRILVLQHGQREAARIAGLNEDTVCSWAHRYGWSKTIASKPQARTGNTKLVEKIGDELAENEHQTRLGLSKYAKDVVGELNRRKHKLLVTKEAKDVAQTAAIVHGWDAKEQSSGNVVVNVAILGISPDEVSE
jgi:hypothetical protein